MTADTDFMQYLCGTCGGSQRLVMNGFDVMELVAVREKRILDLEIEVAALRQSLASKKKNPKPLFCKWKIKTVEKSR